MDENDGVGVGGGVIVGVKDDNTLHESQALTVIVVEIKFVGVGGGVIVGEIDLVCVGGGVIVSMIINTPLLDDDDETVGVEVGGARGVIAEDCDELIVALIHSLRLKPLGLVAE